MECSSSSFWWCRRFQDEDCRRRAWIKRAPEAVQQSRSSWARRQRSLKASAAAVTAAAGYCCTSKATVLSKSKAIASPRSIMAGCARSEPSRSYHPDRLKHPLRRAGARGSGQWQRISWDQALDEISQRLLAIRAEFGAEAIALGTGTGRHHIRWVSRFGHALGTPNWCEPGFAQCFHPRVNTCILTFGEFPVSDYTGDVAPA